MQLPQGDVDLLRRLGEQVAEIASLPIQQERRELMARIDRLEQAKPPVHIYQEPWNELNVEGELDLHCQEDFCRGIEQDLRRTLYKWRHYQGDMIVGEAMVQPLCIVDTGFGIREDVDIRRTSETSSVVSRHFHIQIKEESDAEKIQFPRVHHDAAKTEEQFEARSRIFEGILPVVKQGVGSFWFNPWDDLVRWTGVQEVLMDMALRPDYVHKIVDRLVSAWMCRLDQYEEQGLLTVPCKKMWGVGAAQIFSEVSPAMHKEFALQHEARWYSRFGWTYYGCCEPLHNKVDVIREAFPNLKKISMSPWVDFAVAVPKVGSDLIFAWKPNPAWLATETWHPEEVRRYLREHLEQAFGGGCVVEIHLKDISTVRWEPRRLWEWARIADEVTAEFA